MQNHNHTSCANITSTIVPARFNIKKIFFTMLFSLYLGLSLIHLCIWPLRVIILIVTLLGLLALILLSIRIRREDVLAYIYIVFLATSFLISSLMVGRTGQRLYVPIFFIICSPGIAMILIRGYVYSWGGYIVFYGLAVYYFILMLAGFDGYSASTYGTSVNGIGIVMLVACISLYIILNMEKKNIDLIPALITLVISIWGVGRSAIGASFIILIGLLLIRLRYKPKYIYIVLVCLFVFYLFFDVLCNYLMDNWFFSNSIMSYLKKAKSEESSRWPMWVTYYNNLDIFRLIFGVNVVEDRWAEGTDNEYNYHNSFIHLHIQTGFMGLITLVLIIFAVFKFYRTNKVFFILLLAFILRSSTDLFLFFSRFDFIHFFFIFYFLKSTSSSILHIKALSAEEVMVMPRHPEVVPGV